MKPFFLPYLGLIVCSIALAADAPPKPREGTSTVSFSTDKEGNKTVIIHNHSYLFTDTVYLVSGPNPTAFLIEQDVTSSTTMLSDTPPEVKLKARAWSGEKTFPAKPVWTLETEGDTAAIENRLYAVTRDGFQDDFNVYRYFRMADGKPAYTSNTPLLNVYTADDAGIPRHIAYRDQFGEKELSPSLADRRLAGIVYYGDDNGATQKLAILGWPSDDEPSPPASYLKFNGVRSEYRDFYLSANKETGVAALSHFSVVIVLEEGMEVEIPFENDAPQLAKARLPKGFTVEVLP